ncbi:Fungal specific transcription factor domain [Ceratobasidium sp. AG-Ba]|nr:Fungal specific transcription factor domain [Ceratobasidium sp. AG-Ba]QRW04626.1 Fungal specific transcription factor domain [Ceratobasidium sp. AG-Ba]
MLDFSFLSDPPSTLYDSQSLDSGWWDVGAAGTSSAQRQNTAGNYVSNIPHAHQPSATLSSLSESNSGSLATFRPPGASGSVKPNMTAGQASLFQALLSLGEANTSPLSYSASQTPSSHGSTWPSPDSEQDESATSEESDPEGIREIVCRTPTLDKNAPTNSLPFVLQSYSRWITRTVFEPLKVAGEARDWLMMRFNQSEDSRWTVTLMANVFRMLSKTSSIPTNVLPAISLLRNRAERNIAIINQNSALVPSGSQEAMRVLDDTIEVIAVQFMSNSLASNLTLMKEAAPVYQRACANPPGTPIDLPSSLLHSEFPLRHYPAIDIMLSLGICIPMQFRYKVHYAPELCNLVTDMGNVGLQWMHGIPDQFILLLARMHMLRVDFAPHLDPQIEAEIEEEIRTFQPVVTTSTDPFLSVVRLAVQEAWRQTLYIYLYMGLCGADASDSRVVKALRGFVRLLDGTKPGRTPAAFLMLPMITSGVACRRAQDRELIRSRMGMLRECQQPGTCGYETLLTLNELWNRVDSEGRPAVWMDLRISVATISGIM